MRSDLTAVLQLYEAALGARDKLLLEAAGAIASPGRSAQAASSDPLENFHPKSDTDYRATLLGRELTKSRRHERLVRNYGEWQAARGWRPATEHPRDLVLYSDSGTYLVEAKVVYRGNATEAVRAAAGQLLTYAYFLYPQDDQPNRVALFSEPVGSAYVDFLSRLAYTPPGGRQARGAVARAQSLERPCGPCGIRRACRGPGNVTQGDTTCGGQAPASDPSSRRLDRPLSGVPTTLLGMVDAPPPEPAAAPAQPPEPAPASAPQPEPAAAAAPAQPASAPPPEPAAAPAGTTAKPSWWLREPPWIVQTLLTGVVIAGALAFATLYLSNSIENGRTHQHTRLENLRFVRTAAGGDAAKEQFGGLDLEGQDLAR